MINLFKPPVFTTAPVKQSGAGLKGPRWARKKYVAVNLATLLPIFLLIAYMASTSWSKHPDGPAGSALVYVARESGPILIAMVGLISMMVVLFFATMGRLRDINASPLWALLYFIPALAIPLVILLSLVPGTRGPNKYGDDPRVEDANEMLDADFEDSKLTTLRNWATHKNTNNQLQTEDKLIDIHDSIKELLSRKEIVKVLKKSRSLKVSRVVVVGFDKTNSKYYISVSPLGTPVEELDKEYFINYEVMCVELISRTGLPIEYLANEGS